MCSDQSDCKKTQKQTHMSCKACWKWKNPDWAGDMRFGIPFWDVTQMIIIIMQSDFLAMLALYSYPRPGNVLLASSATAAVKGVASSKVSMCAVGVSCQSQGMEDPESSCRQTSSLGVPWRNR
jgi:hypothetical protein